MRIGTLLTGIAAICVLRLAQPDFVFEYEYEYEHEHEHGSSVSGASNGQTVLLL